MQDTELDDGGANLFERGKIRDYLVFVTGSLRRRRALVICVFVAIVGATIGILFAIPRTYHVEAKVLAQTNQALAVRGDGPSPDLLTRAATETVLRRDSLVAIIQQTDLLRHWREHRAPVQRLRDAIARRLRGHDESEQDQTDAMVELLEKQLLVWTADSGSTVTIAINWTNAQMACRLVDAAQQNFLDTRYAQEITALVESIGILRSHATSLKADVDEAVAAIDRIRVNRDAPPADVKAPVSPRPRTLSPPPPEAQRSARPNPRLEQLKVKIDAKQRVIDDLEDLRRHRLQELQARLAEARVAYTESHPVVTGLNQTIATLSVESPQVRALRQEAAGLRAEYERSNAAANDDFPAPNRPPAAGQPFEPNAAPAVPQLTSDVLRLDLDLREDRDPAVVYARGQLRDEMEKYAALRTQIQTAQIDLETAQAAFKYRYSVVMPAHLPRTHVKPNFPLVLFAAFIAAIFAAIMTAVVVDIRAGRLVERWQIERLLDRPVLGEIELPQLGRPDFE